MNHKKSSVGKMKKEQSYYYYLGVEKARVLGNTLLYLPGTASFGEHGSSSNAEHLPTPRHFTHFSIMWLIFLVWYSRNKIADGETKMLDEVRAWQHS